MQYNNTHFSSCYCDSGYYRPWGALVDDDCLPCPKNCRTCDRTGQCTACSNDYYLEQDGKCVEAEVRENVEMDNGICGIYRKEDFDWYCQKKQLAPMEKDRKANDCIGRIKMAHVFITTVVPRIATPVPIGENAYVAKADTFCKTANAFPNANGTNTGMNLVNVSRVRI